ncbi:MAG: hypothetical protein ACLRWQ_17635 [Flavonifractor plautii]
MMNKLARSVLALYSYDDSPDDLSLENNMRQSICFNRPRCLPSCPTPTR